MPLLANLLADNLNNFVLLLNANCSLKIKNIAQCFGLKISFSCFEIRQGKKATRKMLLSLSSFNLGQKVVYNLHVCEPGLKNC